MSERENVEQVLERVEGCPAHQYPCQLCGVAEHALAAAYRELEALLAEATPILGYVSRGRGFVDVEPYPDAAARRVLGCFAEHGGGSWLAS